MNKISRFPTRRFFGRTIQIDLQELKLQRDRTNEVLDNWAYTGRRLMGLKHPEWQNQKAWPDERCVRFIESIWLGINPGHFIMNDSFCHEYKLTVLDGQQRLRAIERYWLDEFSIKGEDGMVYLWSELTKPEQDIFLRIKFPWIETRHETEEELMETYKLHNFSDSPLTTEI
ncbi:DUF262 domain-containing protein [Metapseudomonas furukawaii]